MFIINKKYLFKTKNPQEHDPLLMKTIREKPVSFIERIKLSISTRVDPIFTRPKQIK